MDTESYWKPSAERIHELQRELRRIHRLTLTPEEIERRREQQRQRRANWTPEERERQRLLYKARAIARRQRVQHMAAAE
jgi:hypothetical protein